MCTCVHTYTLTYNFFLKMQRKLLSFLIFIFIFFKLVEVINANHEAVGHSGQDLHTDEKVLTLWEILQERR